MKVNHIISLLEKRHWPSLLFFVMLVFLIYANTIQGPFVLDDGQNIRDNPHIRLTKLTVPGLINAWLESPCKTRPIANISFALNYYFHRYDVTGYHLFNIIIHVTTGILLYFFFRTTLNLPSLISRYGHHSLIPFFAVLIWLVHPIQTQSVSYIVQRMNAMAAMFYICALLLYVKARLAEGKKKKWGFLVGAGCSWVLALGSKEIAATLPLFVFLYEWYFFRQLSVVWLKRRIVYVVGGCVLIGVLIFMYFGPNPFAAILRTYTYREFSLTERVLTQFRVVIHYLGLLAYPHPSRLTLDYDFPISHSLVEPVTTVVAIGVVTAMMGLAYLTARKEPLLSFSMLWFLGNLIIESSVIGLEMVFEHRTYLPSMFVSLYFVMVTYHLLRRSWLRGLVLFAAVAVCSAWTHQRNNVWADDVELGRDCVEKSPKKARPHTCLGFALFKRGRLDEAMSHYTQALRINGSYPIALNGLGAVLLKQGKAQEALPRFSRALEINPDYDDARRNLQIALRRLEQPRDQAEAHNRRAIELAGEGRLYEALENLRDALRIRPNFSEAHYNMGNVLAGLDKPDEAIVHFLEAVRIRPDYAEAHNNLGIAFARKGKAEHAMKHFSRALQIRPSFSEAKNNLMRIQKTLSSP